MNRTETHETEPRSAPTRTQRRELSALPARLLAELPAKTRLFLYVPGIPKDIAIATHELPEPRPVMSEVLFDGLELRAIVEAASHDRLWPTDFLELCIRKWNDPEVRVDRQQALQGALGLSAGDGGADAQLSVEDLLQRLGATLIALELDDRSASELDLAA